MTVKEVQVAELEAAMQGGARVIDVRETNEYVEGHVPGAVHIALSTVPEHVDAFRGEGPTYVVCRSGARSMRACEFLSQQGIDVINVAGGTLDWISSGRAVVTGNDPA
jgi:rhodanese-related sulfurtransferase